MWDGFLLGLANGTSCLATCAPVLVPYLLAEARDVWRNVWLLGQFLAGRLVGYLAFGVLAWLTGEWIRRADRPILWFGVIYLVTAIILLGYAIFLPRPKCTGEQVGRRTAVFFRRSPQVMPLLLGLLTGINLCPPFAAALGAAATKGTIGETLFFFFSFFLGTAIFFLPLSLVGSLRRHNALNIIGRLAAGIIGGYYLLIGSLMVYGGLNQ